MQFALPACKFEGFDFGHQFLHDLMSPLDAITLSVREEEMNKFTRKIMKAFTSEYLEKLYKSLPKQIAALTHLKEPHTNF